MPIEDIYYYQKLAQVGVEEFTDIPGYEGYYQVSNLGRIKSLHRVIRRSDGKTQTFQERILKPNASQGGYLFCRLAKIGVHRSEKIHVMSAKAFFGVRPADMQTCHNNGDCTDNRLDNLRYDTARANYEERSRHYFRSLATAN